MAYTNSPQTSTYKTEEVVFTGTDLFRSGDTSVNRDLQIVNLFYDRISQENQQRDLRLKKRFGLSGTGYSLTKVSNSDILRGSFYDIDQNGFYWAVGNKVYSANPDVGTSIRLVTTLSTSSGYVGFCAYAKSDATRYVCITDGIDLWLDDYASTTCTQVVSPDLPTPHQPYPVYIDGYLMLIKKNSAEIWNSDLDDPFGWTAGNFIEAEISSDYSLRLFKVKNYLISVGYNSIEYFWDAANTTGSPFSRNDSPTRNIGYITGGVLIGETVFFVGQDSGQNASVYAINSFKIERVSNPVVDRTIQTLSAINNVKNPINLDQDGFCVSMDGHNFYVLVTPQTTWAYDITEKIWYEWKGSDNTGLKIEAAWGMYNGATYCAIKNQPTISIFSPTNYQDFGANFTCRYTTDHMMFGTGNWKVLHRLYLNCSMHNFTGTSFANVSWSDNDWADSGTTPRNINIFSSSPYITKCGKFRNRSFRIEYRDNYPFFMTGLYLDLNIMGI